MQSVGFAANGFVAIVAYRRDGNGERRKRLRPENPLGVIVLLDGGRDDSGDPDAVAPHLQDLRLTVDVQISCTERRGIDIAERENVSHLDTSHDIERALAVGRRIALHYIADIGNPVRLAAIAAEIDAEQVKIRLVGATDEVAHDGDRTIDDERDVRRNAHRAEVAGFATGRRDDFRFAGPAPG